MRRKKERSKQGQTNKQGKATQHTQGSHYELPWVGLEPTTLYTLDSRQSALPTELPRQLSWLGPNLTSHSTPDEQANHQLSMKEKAGAMKPPTCTHSKIALKSTSEKLSLKKSSWGGGCPQTPLNLRASLKHG